MPPISPFDVNENDWGVKQEPPQSETDARIPLAQEFRLDTLIESGLIMKTRLNKGWNSPPILTLLPGKTLNISGNVLLPTHSKYSLEINTEITIPNLANSEVLIRQNEYLNIVGFIGEVGADQDPILGQVEFAYRDPQSDGTVNIETVTKENSKRYRSFWCLVLSEVKLDELGFIDNLASNLLGQKILEVKNKTATGFMQNDIRIYCLDESLSSGQSYVIVPELISIIPIATTRRLQNYLEKGYTWGNGGEEPLAAKFNLIENYKLNNSGDINQEARKRSVEIFSGKPGSQGFFNKTVQNLLAGNVAGNPGRAGESASAPNGSVCLANDQRISFTNQKIVQKWACATVTAGSDTDNNAVVSFGLNSNSPIGTRFSENKADHKIFALDGTEQTFLGKFQSLGTSGSLTWVAEFGSSISPGQKCLFVPGIIFPSGSGFSVPFDECQSAWLNAASISSANIRDAEDDLDAYEDPANNENYILILGKERAALHYIYKKINVLTSATGVAVIPETEKGVFAFIESVDGRLDSPAHAGLAGNVTVKALVYYPPRSLEQWQLQFSYCQYQGLTDTNLINGARVISQPLIFLHTQGGGASAFFGDRLLKRSPISMHLPYLLGSENYYSLNTKILIPGEAYEQPVSFREFSVVPGSESTIPHVGDVLKFSGGTVSSLGRSLSGIVEVENDGGIVGCQIPYLTTRLPYQAVFVLPVEKNGRRYLLIGTHNTKTEKNLILSSESGTAIDIFPF